MDHPGRDFDTGCRDLFRKKIFDRLHIMIRRALEFFDPARVGEREVGVQCAQPRRRAPVKREFLERRIFGQREQPFDLDPDAVADERKFAEIRGKRSRACVVAAVDRRYGHQGIDQGILESGAVESGSVAFVFLRHSS